MGTTPTSRIWMLALLAQAAIAGLLIWAVPHGSLVDARLIIAAPPVVSTALVSTAETLPDHPFEARAAASADEAVADLRAGEADAVVIVDLTADQDQLIVSAASGERGRAALQQAVSEVEAGLGRTLHVTTLAIEHERHTPYVVVLASLVLGFAAAVAVTWRHGSFATSFRAGLVRFTGFAALGAVAGACCAWLPWPTPVLVAALVTAAAVTTAALSALFGLVGLALSSLLFILTAAPLGRFSSPMFVPHPWQELNTGMLHGAGLDLATSMINFCGSGQPRAWAVLLAWIGIGTLTLVLSRVLSGHRLGQVR